jgi:hypothetical protein
MAAAVVAGEVPSLILTRDARRLELDYDNTSSWRAPFRSRLWLFRRNRFGGDHDCRYGGRRCRSLQSLARLAPPSEQLLRRQPMPARHG